MMFPNYRKYKTACILAGPGRFKRGFDRIRADVDRRVLCLLRVIVANRRSVVNLYFYNEVNE